MEEIIQIDEEEIQSIGGELKKSHLIIDNIDFWIQDSVIKSQYDPSIHIKFML